MSEKQENEQIMSPRIQRQTSPTLKFQPKSHEALHVTPDQIAAPPHEEVTWPEVHTIKRKRSNKRKVLDAMRAVFSNFLHA